MKNDFQISHNKDSYTAPILFHSHDFYEIYLFADGNVKYYIENESYALSKGDVLIIPPGKLHRPVIENNAPYERYVLWLYAPLLENEGIKLLSARINALTTEKNTRRAEFKGDSLTRVTWLFDRLRECFCSAEPGSEYSARACITLILDEIAGALSRTEKFSDEPGGLVRQVIAYINENVAEAPSLDELAARFFVSKYYLSHRFREHTRTTVHQYILMKKVNLAKKLLESGAAPQRASESCGFSTYSNFYKAFLAQTGVSPREYGRQRGNQLTGL